MLLSEVRKIVGKQNASSSPEDLLVYATDASGLKGKTLLVTWPQNTQQVAKIVQLALKKNTNLVPRGGGTGLAGGTIPQNSIVVDLSKMNKIISIKNNTATVEAGVVLDKLDQKLENKKKFFPIQPSSHLACTIGGMISTNAQGNHGIKYGPTSEWIQQITLVDGAGKTKKITGQKTRQICGTEGTLGIITQAVLKLAPRPKQKTLTIIQKQNTQQTLQTAKQNMRKALAIEYLDPYCSRLAGFSEKHTLLIEYPNDKGQLSGKQLEKAWQQRESVGQKLTLQGYPEREDPYVPFQKLPEFLSWLQKEKIPTFGHIATGILHPRFQKNQKTKTQKMFKLVEKLGGKVSGEHGIGLLKKQYLGEKEKQKHKKLKQKYDPKNILNRGKIL